MLLVEPGAASSIRSDHRNACLALWGAPLIGRRRGRHSCVADGCGFGFAAERSASPPARLRGQVRRPFSNGRSCPRSSAVAPLPICSIFARSASSWRYEPPGPRCLPHLAGVRDTSSPKTLSGSSLIGVLLCSASCRRTGHCEPVLLFGGLAASPTRGELRARQSAGLIAADPPMPASEEAARCDAS